MPPLRIRAAADAPRDGRRWVAVGFAASVATSLVSWVMPQPVGSIPGRAISALLVLACAVMLLAWWQLGPRFPHPLAATVVWALPLLAAAPLMSLDVWAYLTQGWMVINGHDPYVMMLGEPGLPGIEVGEHWIHTTSVYPAGSLLVFGAVYWLSGGIPWLGVLLFRVLHLGCLFVVAWAVKVVAARFGVSRTAAWWVGIASPLLLIQWIGGVHNDAVLVAVLALAVVAASRGGWSGLVLGGALVGLALTVKQSGAAAGLGIVALAWAATPGKSWAQLAGRAVAAGLAAVVAFGGISLATFGFGWSALTAGSPLEVTSNSPWSWIVQAVANYGPEAWFAPALRSCTLLAGLTVLAAWVWLVVRFGPRPEEPGRPWAIFLGGLLAFALLGPGLQAWYLTWVVPFVALAQPGVRRQRVWLAGTVVTMLLTPLQFVTGVFPSVPLAIVGTWWLWRRLSQMPGAIWGPESDRAGTLG
ncbi:MAG: polyprenol phosphomannose-dependent alpha 1,6 mannosyltransferase MptB [Propionibacteriaceae bacterium]|nr:polyprenol phosphomannose-dependent alpha 1,6 mannosyltransferase MptB [Propionibacteriaceae bacterium]